MYCSTVVQEYYTVCVWIIFLKINARLITSHFYTRQTLSGHLGDARLMSCATNIQMLDKCQVTTKSYIEYLFMLECFDNYVPMCDHSHWTRHFSVLGSEYYVLLKLSSVCHWILLIINLTWGVNCHIASFIYQFGPGKSKQLMWKTDKW